MTGRHPPAAPHAVSLVAALFLTACASGPPEPPYPAFIQVEELPDVFVAGLPGIRAKQLAVNPQTRAISYRILLPPEWEFGTGASPGKSIEMFVLRGRVQVAEVTLDPGGYLFIPEGSLGVSMSTDGGADALYFLADPDPGAVIQTPLIMNSTMIDWNPLSDDPLDLGLWTKPLRQDPGSGATTWLVRIDPGATLRWRSSTVVEEGYMLAGDYQHAECIDGEVATGVYAEGGYFKRPAGVANGGPESIASTTTVWFMRSHDKGAVTDVPGCSPTAGGPATEFSP